jgi:hypothetical protein
MNDPCAVGEIFDFNNGAGVDDGLSMISGTSGRFSRPSTTSNNHHLLQRIFVFRAKGWLSQQESKKYQALLSAIPTNEESKTNHSVTNHVIHELEEELNILEQNMMGGTMLHKQTHLTSLLSPTTSCMTMPAPVYTERPKGLNVLPQQNPLEQTNNNNNNNNTSAIKTIVEPEEFKKTLPEEQMQELFVEMCFFARLGFVQPPCCLQCSYRESVKEASPQMNCGRWVVWRKNAHSLFHPQELEGNLIVVRCNAARNLLAGDVVEGFEWDKTRKILFQVLPRE